MNVSNYCSLFPDYSPASNHTKTPLYLQHIAINAKIADLASIVHSQWRQNKYRTSKRGHIFKEGSKMKTSKLAILSIVAILFLAGSNLFAHSHRRCRRPRPRRMKRRHHMRRTENFNRGNTRLNNRSYSSNQRAANNCSNYVNGYYTGSNSSYNNRNRVTTTVTTTTTVTRTITKRSRY